MRRLSYISSATFTATQSALFVMYPVLAETLGLSASAIVGCFAFGSFLFLWASPFWAARSEGDQRLPVMRVGIVGSILALLGLMALLLFGSGLSPLYCLGLLALSRIVYGLSASAIVPVAQALLGSHQDRRERVRSLATLSMLLNMGRLFGPLLVLPFLAFSPVGLLAIPLALFMLLLPLSGTGKLDLRPRMILDFRIRDVWPNEAKQQWLFLLALLTTAVLALLQSSLGVYLQESFNLTSSDASRLMAKLLLIGGLSSILVQFGLRTLMRHPWQGSMPLGTMALSLGSLGLFFTQTMSLLYLSIVVMSAGIALLTPSYISAMSLHADAEGQGRSAGNLSTAHSLGYALGALLSSFALRFAVDTPFAIASILSLGTIVLMGPIYAGRIPEFQVEAEGKNP